jgi:hypothetical protein
MSGKHPEIVVQFPAGISILINFFINDNVIELKGSQVNSQVKFKQTLYAKKEGENLLLFSINGQDWKSFEELLTGSLTASFDWHEGKPSFLFGTDLNIQN